VAFRVVKSVALLLLRVYQGEGLTFEAMSVSGISRMYSCQELETCGIDVLLASFLKNVCIRKQSNLEYLLLRKFLQRYY